MVPDDYDTGPVSTSFKSLDETRAVRAAKCQCWILTGCLVHYYTVWKKEMVLSKAQVLVAFAQREVGQVNYPKTELWGSISSPRGYQDGFGHRQEFARTCETDRQMLSASAGRIRPRFTHYPNMSTSNVTISGTAWYGTSTSQTGPLQCLITSTATR